MDDEKNSPPRIIKIRSSGGELEVCEEGARDGTKYIELPSIKDKIVQLKAESYAIIDRANKMIDLAHRLEEWCEYVLQEPKKGDSDA